MPTGVEYRDGYYRFALETHLPALEIRGIGMGFRESCYERRARCPVHVKLAEPGYKFTCILMCSTHGRDHK